MLAKFWVVVVFNVEGVILSRVQVLAPMVLKFVSLTFYFKYTYSPVPSTYLSFISCTQHVTIILRLDQSVSHWLNITTVTLVSTPAYGCPRSRNSHWSDNRVVIKQINWKEKELYSNAQKCLFFLCGKFLGLKWPETSQYEHSGNLLYIKITHGITHFLQDIVDGSLTKFTYPLCDRRRDKL